MSGERDGLVGAIEAGGTKFVCAIGTGPGRGLIERAQFSTGNQPSELLEEVVDWFVARQAQHGQLAALGVASFGPIDLDEQSATYGFITTTPKTGWRQTDLLGPLRRAFPGVPIGFDTDVNGAALGESRWGAARGLQDFIYVTVGTGIGGGGMSSGRLLHGLMHPEMGHLGLPQLPADSFAGTCPFHGRCWEGLCSGPAIAARAGMSAEQMPPDDPAWEMTIRYMAHALANLSYVLSPRRIILGGSVRKAGLLGEVAFFARLRTHLSQIIAGYLAAPQLQDSQSQELGVEPSGLANYIVPPELGDDAGVCGALALAQLALAQQQAS